MSDSWSFYIIVLVVVNILGNAWLLFSLRKNPDDAVSEGETLSHEFDGIEEFNNPLPRWWLWLFVGSILFAIAYLILYPGLGKFPGVLGWTSINQWEAEETHAAETYGPIFAQYAQTPIPDLLGDKRAVDMGGRIFANNCSPCHGSDARGNKGYPNLTDGDWLHGGDPDTITLTVTNGRNGMMPPHGPVIGEEGVVDASNYVLSLSGREHDAEAAERGEKIFKTICFACHGPDGKGIRVMGSANLTDNTWLHGGTLVDIQETIRKGRMSQMPAHKDILGAEKVHLVALYVYSLSQDK